MNVVRNLFSSNITTLFVGCRICGGGDGDGEVAFYDNFQYEY